MSGLRLVQKVERLLEEYPQRERLVIFNYCLVLAKAECMFQAKSTADSDASRPLVPVDVDQRFRCKASTN
jgi:hypothetical protein